MFIQGFCLSPSPVSLKLQPWVLQSTALFCYFMHIHEFISFRLFQVCILSSQVADLLYFFLFLLISQTHLRTPPPNLQALFGSCGPSGGCDLLLTHHVIELGI